MLVQDREIERLKRNGTKERLQRRSSDFRPEKVRPAAK